MSSQTVVVDALPNGSLIVWSVMDSRRLFNNGFYGKPLGNPKPKEDFDEPLILDIVEGVYLQEKGIIVVKSAGRKMTLNRLTKLARKQYEGFDEKYRVYKDLRDCGLIVTPGMKYGCDFAVYEHGPGIDHAPYIIQVKLRKQELTADEVVKAGRLASTVRKTFITALADDEEVKYLEFKWWRA